MRPYRDLPTHWLKSTVHGHQWFAIHPQDCAGSHENARYSRYVPSTQTLASDTPSHTDLNRF